MRELTKQVPAQVRGFFNMKAESEKKTAGKAVNKSAKDDSH